MESRCIPASEYDKSNGYTTDLKIHGYYLINVRATSLAGNGTWTRNIFIELPRLDGK